MGNKIIITPQRTSVKTVSVGGGGGGVSFLEKLVDVDATGKANNNTLVYDEATGKYIVKDVPGIAALNDSLNVTYAMANSAFIAVNSVAVSANAWSNTKVSAVLGSSGEIFSSGGVTPSLNLVNTGIEASTYGGATQIPVFTVDGKGRLVYAANVSVQGIQGMDYVYANSIGAASNSWSNAIYSLSLSYANNVGNSANSYAASLTPDLSPVFNVANAAFDQANAAFNQANTGGVSSFGTINANGSLIQSGVPGDVLKIEPGFGIGIAGNNVSNTVTISSTVTSSGSGNELQFSDGAGKFYSLASMYLGGGGTYGTLNLDGTNSNLFLNDTELGLSNYSAMGNYPYMTVDSTSGYVSVYYTFGSYNTGYVQLKANAALKFYSVWSDGVTTNKYEIQLKSPIPTSTSGVVTYDLILPSANANTNEVLVNDGSGNTYWTPLPNISTVSAIANTANVTAIAAFNKANSINTTIAVGSTTTSGGASGQILFDSGSVVQESAGLTFNATNPAVNIAGGTVTASNPVLDLSQTWNNSGVTFTGVRLNIANTNSGSASLLQDWQIGGASVFALRKDGTFVPSGNGSKTSPNYQVGGTFAQTFGIYRDTNVTLAFTDGTNNFMYVMPTYRNFVVGDSSGTWNVQFGKTVATGGAGTSLTLDSRTTLLCPATATLQLGTADAASPNAQTLQVQSVVAGTSNTAGPNFTIAGSKGTGTGVGGSILFQVSPAGTAANGTVQNALATALTIEGTGKSTFNRATSTAQGLYIGSATAGFYADQVYWVKLGSSGWGGDVFTFNSSGQIVTAGTTSGIYLNNDVIITRDAAGTLALRNGTNAQAFRIYNTYTDSANYERGKIAWSSNVLVIGTEKAGTGTARNVELQTDGTTRVTISSTVTRVGTSELWNNGQFYVTNKSGWQTPSDGVITISNYAVNNFDRLQFGGTTSSFPALKRSGATLQVRLADDSADAPISCGNITSSGSLTAITKSFDISHPTKPDMRLRYGSLEGPENGVYIRGKINGNVIELPDYWTGLVDEDSITVQLTAIGRGQTLYVTEIVDNKVYIEEMNTMIPNCYYFIQAERKDVEKLVVEY